MPNVRTLPIAIHHDALLWDLTMTHKRFGRLAGKILVRNGRVCSISQELPLGPILLDEYLRWLAKTGWVTVLSTKK